MLTRFLIVAPIFLSLCGSAWAQLTLSTIRGTVSDPAGALVAGAEVLLVNTLTNFTQTVKTTQSGDFEIADLRPATYRLTVTAPGFKKFVADNVILEGNQVRRINVPLVLGAVGSEITINEGAAVISTDSSKLLTTIGGKKYGDVPWVGAEATLDPSLIITTAPMVSQTNGVWSSQWAGQSSSQVQEGQDGHTNDGAVNQINDILDVEEVTIVAVNNTAEFARVGYMNMVTKSGTNQFHGRALYWHQNSALGARDFFADRKTKTLIHTSSGSFSGPIKKDKLFFYTSANILKVPSKQFYLQTVPTVKMRSGDFSQLLGLASPVVVKDPSNGLPFPGNIIPANRISSVSKALNENYLPTPNRGGADALTNNYGFMFPYPTDYSLRQDFTQRIDYNISAKNRLMGRLVENRGLYVLPKNFSEFTWTRVRTNLHMVVEDTHIFSPSLVNTFRVGFYKERYSDGDTVYGVTPFQGNEAVAKLGLQGVNPKNYTAQGFPRMDISGYPTLQTQAGGVGLDDHNWGYADTATWSKGKHVIKFGGEFKPQSRYQGNIPEGTYGSFNFNGTFSNYGYSDLLLGIPFQSTRLDPLTQRTTKDNELGLFVTDSFKVNSRLTLDLGLRWDRFGSPYYEDGLMYRWDPQTGNVIIPQSAQGSVSPLFPKNITLLAGDVRQQPKMTNLAPRVGFAYRLSNQTVVRGGYGIFNETFGRYSRIQGGGPFQISETYVNSLTSGVPSFTFPNPFPASNASANIPSQSVTGYPLSPNNGKIHQFNITLERQMKGTGVRLSYVGSRNRGMNYSLQVNKPQPSLTPFAQSRRPYPQYTGTTMFRNDGEQNFNAFTVEVQRKVGQLTFDAHYTLSSNYTNMLNNQNPYAPRFWERDQYTPRNRVVMNIVWELPVGKGRHFLGNAPKLVDYALGGWQLYWIGYFESGHYFSPTFSGADPSNTNTSGGRPDRVCNGNLPSDQRSIGHWFDASCFVAPPAGRFGNSGANVLEGPGYNNQNISISKAFALTERFKFTLTAAGSNAFNHPNFALPAGNISAPGSVGVVGGLVEGAAARRIEIRGRVDF